MRNLTIILGLGLALLAGNAMAYKTIGPTQKGNTLWSIAKQTPLSRTYEMKTVITAIERMNPHAFSGGGTVLKVGVTLKLPTTKAELTQALGQGSVTTTPSMAAAAVSTKTPSAVATTSMTTHAKQLSAAHKKIETLTTTKYTLSQQVSQLTQQLQTAKQNIKILKTDLAQSQGGFAWGWMWFIVLLVVGGWVYYDKTQKASSDNNRYAASRLGKKDKTKEQYKSSAHGNIEPHLTEDAISNAEVPSHGEVVADALIEVAEGRYQAAKARLKEAINHNQTDVHLRLQLLELYAKMNDKRSFTNETDYLLGNLISKTDDIWPKIRALYLKQWVYD